MNNESFNTSLLLRQPAASIYNAIANVRGWWSEEIEGPTDMAGATFNYHFEDIHRCRIRVTEMVPNEKITWLVTENYFKPGIFGEAVQEENVGKEWEGTSIRFTIQPNGDKTLLQFSHQGLLPAFECYTICSNGWTHYINESLQALITTGEGKPNKTGRPVTADEAALSAADSKQ